MSKIRSFTIYLLKAGSDEKTSLKHDHKLQKITTATNLPNNASLYIQDSSPHPPWWKQYFGIRQDLYQVLKSALIFIESKNRVFVLCFGHVAHNLMEGCFEYDFGLRVTLNCIDPSKLKSTDSLEPGVGRRQRTQSPIGSDLTYFDFDRDSAILRKLTGKVKEEHQNLFKNATGSSSLRIGTNVQPLGLAALCEKLLTLYLSEDYKTTFPDIQNISPVKDPEIEQKLDQKLLAAFRDKNDGLYLAVPDLINFDDEIAARFKGSGESLEYEDVFIDHYYEYLVQNNVDLNEVDIDDLNNDKLQLIAEDGSLRGEHSIYKSLIFDTFLSGQSEVYHLTEGNWYRVEKSYIKNIRDYLDPLCDEINLPAYEQKSEGEYNKFVAVKNKSIICLDQTNISPPKQTAVEPCDLYSVNGGEAFLQHVKISTHSSKLSHLFNQGVNAIELLKLEPKSSEILKGIIKKLAPDKHAALISPIDQNKFCVTYVIVTHKDKAIKSDNLPLFSRISLMRCMKALKLMSVKANFGFVEDKSGQKKGKQKQKNPKRR